MPYRYEYFNEIVNNSAMFLAENKKNLKISVNKVTSLEAELAIWKQRCYEYETFGERSCIRYTYLLILLCFYIEIFLTFHFRDQSVAGYVSAISDSLASTGKANGSKQRL